ncbi:MAG: cytochrome c oxidase subunit 3 [Candidatus Sulfotelmatobacter sp.]
MRALEDGSPPPSSTAVWVAIAAISMMFAAFTSAMVVRQGAAMDWQHLALPHILYLNTLVLLASSITLEMSRRRFSTAGRVLATENGRPALWLYATLGLGILFVAGQYIAWRELSARGVYLATNPSSSFFYVLTATHAIHVLGGLGALIYLISKVRRSILRRSTMDAASLYWHFMDALWVYLLVLLWVKM